MFSCVQLKYLHTRAAKLLPSIFSKISLNPGEAHSLPRSRGQALDCTMYILPSLFSEKPVKSYFLPLGYQCEKKPDENSCCDYLCVAQEDADWKIFEGCWHSFHSECLKDLTYCPICSNHLNNVILSLSESAKSSFVNGGKETDDVETTDPQPDDDTDDDEMESDNLGISINESNIENILNDITLSVMHLSPQSPPHTSSCLSSENLDCSHTASNLLSSVQPPKRSPHCST